MSRWAEGFEREPDGIRGERRAKNNARRAGEVVVCIPWDQPRHWARFRREGMPPGRALRKRAPVDEERVDP